MDMESRMLVTRGWEKQGKRKLLINEYRVSVLQHGKVLETCFTTIKVY